MMFWDFFKTRPKGTVRPREPDRDWVLVGNRQHQVAWSNGENTYYKWDLYEHSVSKKRTYNVSIEGFLTPSLDMEYHKKRIKETVAYQRVVRPWLNGLDEFPKFFKDGEWTINNVGPDNVIWPDGTSKNKREPKVESKKNNVVEVDFGKKD